MSDTQPTGTTGDTGTEGAKDGAKPDETTATTSPKADEGKAPKFEGDFDPDRAARALAGARGDATKHKQRAEALEGQLGAIAKALGLGEDGKPDPDQLTAQLAQTKTEAAQARVENAVLRRAAKVGADAELLLDSRTFLTSVKDLDPSSGTFLDDVEAAIKAAVKENPRYKTAPTGATRAGVELGGASPDGKNRRATDLESALIGRI